MATSSRLWLVSDADPNGMVGRAVFVDADTVEQAAAAGMWAPWDNYADDGDASPPTDAYVLEVGENPAGRYRAVLGAERVPDAFQCCGGMPDMATLGTRDEHTAICERRTETPE